MKIKTYSDFIAFDEPEDLCNAYFFRQGLTKEELARVNAYQGVCESTKLLNTTWLGLNDETEWLFKKIGKLIADANDVLWNFNLASLSETCQLVEYCDGDDQAPQQWHMDIGQGKESHRKISVVIQLSNPSEYEGGELQLNFGDEPKSIDQGEGYTCLFPSYVLNRVNPVVKGKCRYLVFWATGEAFR